MSPMFQSNLNNETGRLSLYKLVAHHPDATFFVKYTGSDLEDYAIFKNDILIVDRSLKAGIGKLAILIEDGDFKIEKVTKNRKRNVEVWGVISYIIHKA